MRDETTRRVLIYRLGSLGDMLVALPALRLVARAFPNAERRMLTNIPVDAKAPAAAAVLDGMGLVDGYVTYPWKMRSVTGLLGLWWRVFRWRPEVLVYVGSARGVETARRDAKFFRICGIRRLIGVPVTEAMQGWFFGYAEVEGSVRDVGEGNLEPEGERLCRNLAELGDAEVHDAGSWSLDLTEGERARAAEALGGMENVIAVGVGTKVQAKNWGVENWRALLGQMALAWPGMGLMLVGSAEESAESEYAADGWRANGGGEVVNLCGKLSSRESAAALEQARMFVGHDSGPMHLAAAVGTRCVAIFSARNLPRQWYPFGGGHRVVHHRVDCWGCMLETCVVQKRKCLTSIGVGEVMDEVRALMEELAGDERMKR